MRRPRGRCQPCVACSVVALIPALRHEGFSLELASILVACPTAGLLLTLIGWAAAADRWGERIVLATGLGMAGVILQIGTRTHGANPHGTPSRFADPGA